MLYDTSVSVNTSLLVNLFVNYILDKVLKLKIIPGFEFACAPTPYTNSRREISFIVLQGYSRKYRFT